MSPTPSNQPEAYFNGSSYLRLQNTISLKMPVGLSFKTCFGGSLLSQQQNEESIEVVVNKKGVIFKAKVDGNPYEEIIFGNYLNNQWHTVFLQYSMGNLTLNVDGEVEVGLTQLEVCELTCSLGFSKLNLQHSVID